MAGCWAFLPALLLCSAGFADSQPSHRDAVIVWLIPSEPATPAAGLEASTECESELHQTGTRTDATEAEIDEFNARLAQTNVTVANTQDPLKSQLIDWSPEMAVPNWVWVRSQKETLRALTRFSSDHGVHIRVRFITWDRALGDLADTWEGHSAYEPPDVVQIGSTWAGYFQSRGRLLTKPSWKVNREGWQDVAGAPACVLPYVTDTHLVFYWKRLPGSDSSSSRFFQMNAGSWQSIVESLRAPSEGGPPFVFPIGLTLNLLHDYASLVWAGGGSLLEDTSIWGNKLDLTSNQALAVPDYLASNSVVVVNGRPRRMIAFPEATHEEVVRSFVRGFYRATIEPANFVGRWRLDFRCKYQKGRADESFWDYAGAAVPPKPFKGGSYLTVWSKTANPKAAFDLAQFLTTDDEYTRVLGASGYLPAGRPGGGVDLFAGSPGHSPGAREFAKLVQQALDVNTGKSYPQLPDFSRVLESRDNLERLQIAWRRMSERDLAAFHRALSNVETNVNRQIYVPAEVYSSISEMWGPASALVSGFLLLLYIANRRRIGALRHAGLIRGFSSAGTLLVETVHGVFHNPVAVVGAGPRDATKSAMIVAALQGWRRGRDARNWHNERIDHVIWRSVILALDSAVSLGVFKKWEQSRLPASDFLADWVNGGDTKSAKSLTLVVEYEPGRKVPVPFLLEQSLVCLLHNSLNAVLDIDFPDDLPKEITVQARGEVITVANPGPPLSTGICDAINNSRTPDEFEQRISALLVRPGETKPGFGLVEAYCILSQCFGGLRVRFDEIKFEIGLPRSNWYERILASLKRTKPVSFRIAADTSRDEGS